jgi:hypothetical protein
LLALKRQQLVVSFLRSPLPTLEVLLVVIAR